MAKAAKSRKSGKPARKSGGAKAKPRKPAKTTKKAAKPAAKVQAKTQAKIQAKTKKVAVPKAKASRAAAPARAVKTATVVADAPQPISAGPAATVLPRPEPHGGRTESQPAESETPPALPVPIASFTF